MEFRWFVLFIICYVFMTHRFGILWPAARPGSDFSRIFTPFIFVVFVFCLFSFLAFFAFFFFFCFQFSVLFFFSAPVSLEF